MTRSKLTQELVNKITSIHPKLTANDIESAADIIFDGISNALAKGGGVEIRGFGSFCLNRRPSRKARNPKTGDAVMVPAKYFPHFKTGKELRDQVNPGKRTRNQGTSLLALYQSKRSLYKLNQPAHLEFQEPIYIRCLNTRHRLRQRTKPSLLGLAAN